MQSDSLIEVTWRPRFTPLEPVCVTARGKAATQLAHRLLQAPEALSRYKGVSAPGLLVILGEAKSLPWVDLVVYLGRDPKSPSLLLPTNLEPLVPPALLERSIMTTHARMTPCALLLDPPSLISLADARTLTRKSLIKWLEADL